jgi:hypothetical protein
MQTRVSDLVPAISCCIILLTASNGALAADWGWAEDEIINGNYGEAAGWVIDSLDFEGGGEYTTDTAQNTNTKRKSRRNGGISSWLKPVPRGKHATKSHTLHRTKRSPDTGQASFSELPLSVRKYD